MTIKQRQRLILKVLAAAFLIIIFYKFDVVVITGCDVVGVNFIYEDIVLSHTQEIAGFLNNCVCSHKKINGDSSSNLRSHKTVVIS